DNEQLGAALHKAADKIRKDAFVADGGRNMVAVQRIDRVFGTGYEVADLPREAVGEKQQALERHIFAERNQVHLVVSADLVAGGIQQACAVRRSLAKCIDIPQEEIRTELPRDGLHARAELGVFSQV